MNELNKAILLTKLNDYDKTALEMLDEALAFVSILVKQIPREQMKAINIVLNKKCEEYELCVFSFMHDCNKMFDEIKKEGK